VNILDKIIETRKEEIKKNGYNMGAKIPEKREVPIISFITPPFVITEIKRSSPSRGKIRKIPDPEKQADIYLGAGSKHISVLTEKDFFNGSLDNLIKIKKKFPSSAILRKDFLLEVEDIEVSYRAGADAVLLIAAILTKEKIAQLYKKTIELGLVALVEVHTKEDVDKVRPFKPRLTGINCRDLKTFKTDLLHPIKIKKLINWDTATVFESGIHSKENSDFAFSSGFDAILTGEAVVRNPSLIARFLQSANNHPKSNFFSTLFNNKKKEGPLIKICGITNENDAKKAIELGADIIGYIFADSPRRIEKSQIIKMKDLPILKACVVVNLHKNGELQAEVEELYNCGAIDIIQCHGDEPPEFCSNFKLPYYKAIRPKNKEELNKVEEYRSPRSLLDAFSRNVYGGSGKRIDEELLKEYHYPLWLAGGINPQNVGEIIEKWNPELIDLSSGVEKSPGIKDFEKMELLFKNIKEAIEKRGNRNE